MQQLCLSAAIAATALLPHAVHAQTDNLIFQVTPGDFNVSTGALTPDVGPAGTETTLGSVTINPTATPNNLPAFNFSGTGGFGLSSAINESSDAVTIFAVVLATTPTGQPSTIVSGGPGTLQYRIDGTGVNAGEQAFLSRDQFQFGNASVPTSTTKFSVIDGSNNPGVGPPAGVIFNINGTTVGDNGGSGFGVGGITAFGAGDNGDGTYNEFFSGEIAEVQVYDGVLGSTQRASIEQTLLTQFGITVPNANFNWVGTVGPFSTASNWDQNAVPSDPGSSLAFINNGGTAQLSGSNTYGVLNFYLGNGSTGVGNVAQTGGALTVGSGLLVGSGGVGTYNISGGTVSAATIYLGSGGGTGTLNQSGGAVTVAGNFVLGSGNGSSGTYTLTAGTMNVSGQTWVGQSDNVGFGNGIINVTGGTFNEVGGYLQFGYGGTSTLNMSGGTINVVTGGFDVLLATFATGTTFNITGGIFNDSGGATAVGYRGAAVFNLGGGTATAQYITSQMQLGIVASLGGVGTLNLNPNGILTTGTLQPAGGGGTVNFSGGVLQAIGNTSSLLTGFSAGQVLATTSAGAIIDTNGFTATLNAPISSPAGVTSGLTKIGAGTLVLAGSNTYSGATKINAGKLQLLSPSLNFDFAIPANAGGADYAPTNASWNFSADGGAAPLGSGITNGTAFTFTGTVPDASGQAAFIQEYGQFNQSLNFPTTGSYTLSFYTEQRPGQNQQIDVVLDNPNAGGLDLGSGGFFPTANWEQLTFTFNETAGSHLLSFYGLDPDGDDETAYVTAVSITPSVTSTASTISTAIPSTSPVIIADNATFDVNNAVASVGSLTGTALSSITLGNGILTTGGDGTSTTFAGAMSGTGSLIKIGAGTQTFSGSNTYTGGTNISGGTLIFAGPSAFPAFTSLTVGAGTTAVAAIHNASSAKNTLFVTGLSIAGTTGAWTGTVDLGNNDMVVRNGSLGTITNQVAQGYANGTWQGSGGIISTAAAANTKHLTTLGVIQNSVNGNASGTALYTSFDGQTVTDADVLVKYTYYGDANLDGKVDGTDYSRIDNGSLLKLTGWYNGDFNYDGVINGSDYTLIDNAYNTQGASLAASVSAPSAVATAQIAGTSAVPEPATLGLIALGAVGLLGRRRRSCN